MSAITRNINNLCVFARSSVTAITGERLFHGTAALSRHKFNNGTYGFLRNNKKIYPPQTESEAPRPAFVCHAKANIKYSPDKMWYVASLVRGMAVDEAVRQLSFVLKKGAWHAKQVILEAQKMAVDQHNVEYKTNLWVAESFVGKGKVYKGVRRHARGRVGEVEYKHCHYFVRLEEGAPPKDYYNLTVSPEEQLDKWFESMRKRKITNTL